MCNRTLRRTRGLWDAMVAHLERVQAALCDFGITALSDLILQLRCDPDALASYLEDHLGTQFKCRRQS